MNKDEFFIAIYLAVAVLTGAYDLADEKMNNRFSKSSSIKSAVDGVFWPAYWAHTYFLYEMEKKKPKVINEDEKTVG